MTFLYGNAHVKEYLQKIIHKEVIPCSLLFSGPDGIGKGLFAEWFAAQILGDQNHPDLHIYKPEGKLGMHSIQSLRQFSEEVYMSPYRGPWKVFIIHDAERMLTYSANALLKTLEEPAPYTIIILISSSQASLLPTILSRCQIVRFQAIVEEDIAAYLQQKCLLDPSQAKDLASRAQGSIGQATKLMDRQGGEIRESILNVLSKGYFADYKDLSQAVDTIVSHFDASKKHIEEEARQERKGLENLTSVQKDVMEKEIEGLLSVSMMSEALSLFKVILGWYRDMALLSVNGNKAYLIHPDYLHDIEQAVQRGKILPLDWVYKGIANAKLSLERSTSLSTCLETLFLHLKLI